MLSEKHPAWWPTAEQKRHADAACVHPDVCNIPVDRQADPDEHARCTDTECRDREPHCDLCSAPWRCGAVSNQQGR